MVFELKQNVKPQLFALAPVAGFKERLVMDLYPANATDVQDPLLALLEDYNKGDRSVRCRRRKAGRSRAKPGATGRLSSCSIRARRRRLRCRGEVSHPRERCGATDRPSPAGADRQRRQYEGLYDPQRRRVYPVESACRQGAEAARRPVRVDSRRRLYQPPAQRLFGVALSTKGPPVPRQNISPRRRTPRI